MKNLLTHFRPCFCRFWPLSNSYCIVPELCTTPLSNTHVHSSVPCRYEIYLSTDTSRSWISTTFPADTRSSLVEDSLDMDGLKVPSSKYLHCQDHGETRRRTRQFWQIFCWSLLTTKVKRMEAVAGSGVIIFHWKFEICDRINGMVVNAIMYWVENENGLLDSWDFGTLDS